MSLKDFIRKYVAPPKADSPNIEELIAAAALPKDADGLFRPRGLAQNFIERYCEKVGNEFVRLSDEAIELLSKIRQDSKGRPYLPCVLLSFISIVAFAAEPTVAVTAQQRYPWNGMVDVAFTITGESGVKYDTSFVARDVVGGTNLTMKTVYKSDGSVAALTNQLAVGSYKWVWNAAADLLDGFNCERVVVDVNANVHPSLYMVIDLSAGSSASSYPVSYLDAVPSGGWTSDYKGQKLVLRKVMKGSNAVAGKMSSDMWVGIFEVTQLQYKNVTGTTPSTHQGNYRPVEHAGYFSCANFLVKLTARTINYSFRMPTREEWRYACRAGNTSSVYSATPQTARYSATKNDGKGGYNTYHTTVGSYSPNAWGLYDMLGNVSEWTSTGLSGSTTYTAYKLGAYYYEYSIVPNDGTQVMGGAEYGGDDQEGFRVFGLAK